MKSAVFFFGAIICSAVIALSWSGQAKGGGVVGNGGGTAEQYFVHAYYHLPEYIRACLNSNICRLTSRERAMLVAIQNTLPLEYKTPNQIHFLSGAKYRKFFTIGGLVRAAGTGNRVGDRIYVYSDELYSASGKPITLGFAIGKLVHEFGHHHGVKDSSNDGLDQLGEKVELGYEHRALVDQTDGPRGAPLTAAYFASGHNYRELLLSDNSHVFDATEDLAGEVSLLCRENYSVEDSYVFDPSPNFEVHNILWRVYPPYAAGRQFASDVIQPELLKGLVPITVNLTAHCPAYPGYQNKIWDITFWVAPTLIVQDVMTSKGTNAPFSHFHNPLPTNRAHGY